MNCQKCGKCCSQVVHAPFLFLSDLSAWRAAGKEFILAEVCFTIAQNPNSVDQEITFRHNDADECIWLDEHKECLIYNDRPLSCRIYSCKSKATTPEFEKEWRRWHRLPVASKQKLALKYILPVLRRKTPKGIPSGVDKDGRRL